MFISWMLIMPSFKKSLIVEQFQGNYLKINAVEFSDLREEASTRLSFTISSFFRKLSTGKDFTRL